MPKKMGVNSKVEVARGRRSAVESVRCDRQERAKEEQYWAEAEGPKSRAARRREEDAEKRAEAAMRKAENRRLTVSAFQGRCAQDVPCRCPAPKVTEAELARHHEEERLRLE